MRTGRLGTGITKMENAFKGFWTIRKFESGIFKKKNVARVVRTKDHEKIKEMGVFKRTRWIIMMTDVLIESGASRSIESNDGVNVAGLMFAELAPDPLEQ
jgi:hypothetical protein